MIPTRQVTSRRSKRLYCGRCITLLRVVPLASFNRDEIHDYLLYGIGMIIDKDMKNSTSSQYGPSDLFPEDKMGFTTPAAPGHSLKLLNNLQYDLVFRRDNTRQTNI